MASPNQGPSLGPDQTPAQGSIFDQTPNRDSNQTPTSNSNQDSASRPNPETNISSNTQADTNTDPGINAGRKIRTLPIDLNSAVFPSDGQAQQQTQYGYLVIYREALTHHFKEHPYYAETLGFSPIFDAGLPQGYVVEYVASTAHNRLPELHVVGHPSGKRFREVKEFANHVFHILEDDVANCDCSLCS